MLQKLNHTTLIVSLFNLNIFAQILCVYVFLLINLYSDFIILIIIPIFCVS